MPLCIISMAIQAEDIVEKYAPESEMFVYALDTFIKHDSHHGIAHITKQMRDLKESDARFRLTKGTSNYIKSVRERLIERKQADKIRLITPFLLASGTSFIDELGEATCHYQKARTHRDRYEERWAYHEMHKRQYEMNAVIEQPKVIGLDLILSNESYTSRGHKLRFYQKSKSAILEQ